MKLTRIAFLAALIASIFAAPQAFGGADGGMLTGGPKGGYSASRTYSISCANGFTGTCTGGLSTCCAICNSACGAQCYGLCTPSTMV